MLNIERPVRAGARAGLIGASRWIVVAAAVIVLGLSGGSAQLQPTKTIKVIVPLAPGGGADILARLLADHIRRTQPIGMIVENRAGAGPSSGPRQSHMPRPTVIPSDQHPELSLQRICVS